MRKKLFLLLIPFLTFAMTACEPSELKVDPEFAPYYEYVGNMKGIEIYCWEKDGAWECCLMPGTNRLKMVEEVRYLQENYPCPIAQMKIILQSYSEEERNTPTWRSSARRPCKVSWRIAMTNTNETRRNISKCIRC